MGEETSDMTDKISTRRVKLPDDEPLLKKIYFSTREDDFKAWAALEQEQLEHMMEMQFAAQKQEYERAYPDAEYRILLFDGKPVGSTITARDEREVRVVDIAILTEFQSRGIGAAVLKGWMDEARRSDRVFALQVLKTNRAVQLYRRLGCEIVGESGSHYAMEWRPDK